MSAMRVSGVSMGFESTRRSSGAKPSIASSWGRWRQDLDYAYSGTVEGSTVGFERRPRRHDSPGLSASTFSMRLLSMNVCAMPLVDQKVESRAVFLCEEMGSYDIVCLQSIYSARERDVFRRAATAAGLLYTRHFENGAGLPLLGFACHGSGLLVCSRYPMIECLFQPFLSTGDPLESLPTLHMGFGVGLIRLRTPLGMVDLYTSQISTQPIVSERQIVLSEAFQVSQTLQITSFVRATHRSSLCVYAGPVGLDSSCAYALITSVGGLRDSYVDTNVSPEQDGATLDALDNTFRRHKHVPSRVDYILYRIRHSNERPLQPLTPLRPLTEALSVSAGDTIEAGINGHASNAIASPHFFSETFLESPRPRSSTFNSPQRLVHTPTHVIFEENTDPSSSQHLLRWILRECTVLNKTVRWDGRTMSLSPHHGLSCMLAKVHPSEHLGEAGVPGANPDEALVKALSVMTRAVGQLHKRRLLMTNVCLSCLSVCAAYALLVVAFLTVYSTGFMAAQMLTLTIFLYASGCVAAACGIVFMAGLFYVFEYSREVNGMLEAMHIAKGMQSSIRCLGALS